MKTANFIAGACALLLGASACTNEKEGRFLNLSTGENVTVVKNKEGQMVDRNTNKPVLLYVDTEAKDTFYGITGEKVNGHLRRLRKGVYVYDDGDKIVKIDGDEYKIKDADSKEKWDGDGDEYKYKDGDEKVKADADDYKVKGNGYNHKVDEDGDVKVETNTKKIKIDGETGERKVKDRSIFGKVKDKVIGN
jgi:hypothetical protein